MEILFKIKKQIILIASIAVTIMVMTLPIYTASADDYSGQCGTDVSWKFSNGALFISGSGEMYDYTQSSQPWDGLKSQINSVVVSSGVTYIGAYSFSGIETLSHADLAGSITSIGEGAFSGCSARFSMTVESNSYAKMYAEYEGFSYIIYGSDDTDESSSTEYYEILTDNIDVQDESAIGGINNDETNTAEEVETDENGNVIVGPYAGAAGSDDLPDAVAAQGVVVYESTEESTEDTSESQTPTQETIAKYSGEYPDSVSWSLDDGTLTISGSGNMTEYDDITKIPWFSKRKEIVSVVISDNITGISSYAFAQCDNLKSVSLPNTLYTIGDFAFYNCKSLKEVSVPSSVLEIGEKAIGFYYDSDTKETVIDSDFTIYGEEYSEAENYALKNNIDFVQKIQKNDLVLTETIEEKNHSFIFKLVVVTCISVVIALAGAAGFYIWQKNGGMKRLTDKNR